MRRRAVRSPNDAADSGDSANKRLALSEIPLLSDDMEPAYCCPSIPAHCIINGDDVSMHLQGDMRCRRYAVVYGRVSTRKHKRWEGDGVLVCRNRFAMLQTEDGKDIARVSAFSKRHLEALEPGHRLVIGGFELEVQDEFHGEIECENLSASSKHGSTSAAIVKPINADDTFQSASGRMSSCSSGRKLGRRFVQPLLRTNLTSSSCNFVVNKNEVDASGEDAVILDGTLARHLRPHQKEGLTFLFRRLKDPGGGVILADEMGLGKSVQAISLLWILLKQFKQKGATNMKFILIAPTSLVDNWRCEFNKWLPRSEQLLFHVTKTPEVSKFMAYCGYSPVLLISYDVVVRCAELLEKVSFALMICDEAHRLKNFNGNLRESVSRLRTERRLLLTGTPIQNNMSEFFSLLDLAKPGAFGSLAQFRNMMANEDGMHDIQLLLSEILLRRTADVNFDNLPPRHEYVLWCRLSKIQELIYNRIIGLASSDHLAIIDMLRKLCNHPSILYQSLTSKQSAFNSCESELKTTVLRAFPSSFEPNCSTIVDSGKLNVFVKMMVSLRETNEKVVVVSNFTKTLDMLSEVCKGIFCTVTRLDGTVVPHRRMQLVDEFNTSSLPNHVFLLSTKAGGVGLNLIGASRLVLFDSDWNPAFDVQAMARIWRDGQKMPCHIYRLVTAGTIDEKILQRQVMKSGLGTVVEVDSLNEPMTLFSDEDLADIFTLNTEVACATHELMECKCGGCGLLPTEIGDEVDEGEIKEHEHSSSVDDSYTFVKKPQDTSATEESASLSDYTDSDHSEKKTEQAEWPSNACAAAPLDSQKADATENAVASGKASSVSILMGALSRWRHYSPECEQQFEQMKLEAGLQLATLREVTFAMRLTSNY